MFPPYKGRLLKNAIKEDEFRGHYWVILTDPDASSRVLCVSLTTLPRHMDLFYVPQGRPMLQVDKPTLQFRLPKKSTIYYYYVPVFHVNELESTFADSKDIGVLSDAVLGEIRTGLVKGIHKVVYGKSEAWTFARSWDPSLPKSPPKV